MRGKASEKILYVVVVVVGLIKTIEETGAESVKDNRVGEEEGEGF